jgi:hypothetical protein
VYSFSWQEDRDLSCDIKAKRNSTDREHEHHRKYTDTSKTPRPSAHAATKGNKPFSLSEDERLVELKKRENLSWTQIAEHFPGRTKGSLQVRYSTRLKDQEPNPPATDHSSKRDPKIDGDHSSRLGSGPNRRYVDKQRDCLVLPEDSPSPRMYGLRQARRVVDRYGYSAA